MGTNNDQSIVRFENFKVRAYMLHGNIASSQATMVSKTSPVNPIFPRQNCGVKGIKFYPLHPTAKTGMMGKGQEKGHGKKQKKSEIQNGALTHDVLFKPDRRFN